MSKKENPKFESDDLCKKYEEIFESADAQLLIGSLWEDFYNPYTA